MLAVLLLAGGLTMLTIAVGLVWRQARVSERRLDHAWEKIVRQRKDFWELCDDVGSLEEQARQHKRELDDLNVSVDSLDSEIEYLFDGLPRPGKEPSGALEAQLAAFGFYGYGYDDHLDEYAAREQHLVDQEASESARLFEENYSHAEPVE